MMLYHAIVVYRSEHDREEAMMPNDLSSKLFDKRLTLVSSSSSIITIRIINRQFSGTWRNMGGNKKCQYLFIRTSSCF